MKKFKEAEGSLNRVLNTHNGGSTYGLKAFMDAVNDLHEHADVIREALKLADMIEKISKGAEQQ